MAFACRISTLLFFDGSVLAQGVTTSAITGTVTDEKGQGLPGATVVAIHTPSGTRYGGITNVDGRYNFPNVRVGGPYTVTVTFVGFREQRRDDITASLGTAANVDFRLIDESTQLTEIVVTGSRSDVFSSERTGAATNITTQQLATLPTTTRTLQSFTRLTPQGNGQSFGGQDPRLNNITIDGSVFNNAFGLGNQPGERTGVSPISLDAIDEVQVNIAPYDVRQGNFVGANVNAVTRSGTNEFDGSVYYFFRNRSLVGKETHDLPIVTGNFRQTQTGFRLGGPIIKNKLFFFVNAELERRAEPATTWLARRPELTNQSGNISRTLASDLDQVSTFLRSRYNYETGPYENFDNETKADKFLVRFDWNISDKHKFNIRYSYLDSDADALISNSNSLGFGDRRTNRNSMSYQNSGYIINEDIQSVIGELNSTFSSKFSNNLIVGYTYQNEDRSYKGTLFPTVDILDGTSTTQGGTTYLSFGLDPFTPNNKLIYSTFQLQDNFSYFAGKHTFTAGINLERIVTNNLFISGSNGVYVYNSLQDFFTAANASLDNPDATTSPVQPRIFQYRYSALPGGAEPLQQLKLWYGGLYLQDEWQPTSRLRLTLGIRGDMPVFEDTAPENPYISGLSFLDENNQTVQVNTGELPNARLLLSPRFGFNLDVKGNRTTQIRGGTGLFTGRPPFVWISNQIGNNGILTGFTEARNSTAYPFTTNVTRFTPTTTNPASNTALTYDIAVTDPNFRFPQTWRSNLAVDQQLPFGIVGTFEGIYSKTLNSARYVDVNRERPTGTFTGPDQRPRYPGAGLTGTNQEAAIRVNDRVINNILLRNTNQGYVYSLTARLEKAFSRNFNVSVAYNFSEAKDLQSPGSVAIGSFTNIRSIRGNNYPDLSYSDNDQRHRVIGSLSYRLEYGGRWGGATQIGLFYEARNQGRFSYRFGGDMNGDGIAGNDLIYIPRTASELTFLPLTVGTGSSAVTFSPEQQAQAFDAYINQDQYLNDKRGQYAARNGGLLPWVAQADLSIVQEIYLRVGKGNKRNTLQVRADIVNVGNLISNNWGAYQLVNNDQILNFDRVTAQGVPQFRFRTITENGQTRLLDKTFTYDTSIRSAWQAQLGVRYIFNR